MLHNSQNSFSIVNDEFVCLKLSVGLSVVQTSYLNCYENGSVFTFGDRMWVAVHISSQLAAKKENVFKNDILFFFIWIPIEQCNLSKIGKMNRTLCLYIVFLLIYSSL